MHVACWTVSISLHPSLPGFSSCHWDHGRLSLPISWSNAAISELMQPRLSLKKNSRSSKIQALSQINKSESRLSLTASPTAASSPAVVSKATPYFLLILVTVIWGSQHAIIKYALANTSLTPSSLNLLRFSLSGLLFTPLLPPPTIDKIQTYSAGIELGLYTFGGFALQSIALLTTSAARSAFLLYLNVKFVPILSLFLYQTPSPPRIWFSAALALLGTTLLANDGTPPSPGDFYSILAAASSALFILRLGTHAPRHPPASLTSVSLTTTAILSTLWYCFSSSNPNHNHVLPLPQSLSEGFSILYLGVVVTAFASWAQTRAQRSVEAATAAVFYALDPVWGAAFAWVGLGESLGEKGWIGAALITIGAVFSMGSGNDNQVGEKTK